LYSTIKYFSSKHVSIISFLWVYSKHEIKKYDFLGDIFRKENQGRGWKVVMEL
jgi:hypothetical protein